MKAVLVIIGDELLAGNVTDTNSRLIASALRGIGIETVRIITTGDNAADIRGALTDARALDPRVIITTGGLGPTRDDVTKSVLADIYGGPLILDDSVAVNVERIFDARGLALNDLTRSQALVPASCRVIQNRCGTAPIMVFDTDSHTLVAMPGVPAETRGMLPTVIDDLRRHLRATATLTHTVYNLHGISESAIAARLADYEESLPAWMHLSYLPQPGWLRLCLEVKRDDLSDSDRSLLAAADSDLARRVSPYIIYIGDRSPQAELLEQLRARGLTLATAESCTGGNIAHTITLVPGSSDVFLGTVVSYSNSVKHGLLGVSDATLEACGAVSSPVVEQMVAGVCRATGARVAVATSGIAGPGGGSPDKPVGTVWFAWKVDDLVVSEMRRLPGDRAGIITGATNEALIGLLKHIAK